MSKVCAKALVSGKRRARRCCAGRAQFLHSTCVPRAVSSSWHTLEQAEGELLWPDTTLVWRRRWLSPCSSWGWRQEETRKVPSLWSDSFSDWRHRLALPRKHQIKRLRSILRFPGVVFARMANPGSYLCQRLVPDRKNSSAFSRHPSLQICKISDPGLLPQTGKG